MLRTVGLGVAIVLSAACAAPAETVPGKVKSIDTDKGTITITVDGADQTFPVEKDSKVWQPGKTKNAPMQDVVGGLGGLKEGQPVVLTTDKKDGKDVVTQIKLEEAAKKKKKKT